MRPSRTASGGGVWRGQTLQNSMNSVAGHDTASRLGLARALLIWGLVRVPLILLLAFLFRGVITAAPVFDGVGVTLRVIDLLSLPVSRTLLFILLAAVFGLLVVASRRLDPIRGYVLLLTATAVMTVVLFSLTGTPLRHALIPIFLAATNFLPDSILDRRTSSRGMAVAVGITEALIIRRHVSWLAELAGIQGPAMNRVRMAGWALAVLLLSGCLVVLVKGGRLIPVEQAIRMPDTVSIIMHDDFNGLALDTDSLRLYATGHGLENILEFDVSNPDFPVRESEVVSGGAQGIFRDALNNELSLFNGDTKQIQFIDAETLKLNRSIDVPQLASGDPWIAYDPISDTIALVSEADIDDGVAFILLDHVSGEILDTRELDAGNIQKHPEKPWLYMSFFRRTPEVMIYDMAAREVIARAPAPARIDRIMLLAGANELLATSPVTSEVVRLDADTLEQKAMLKAPFGVRTLAVDPQRELLFAGSFVTGQITTYDANTYAALDTIYLGPWLRSIELDAANGIAYVSSNGVLYRWDYGQGH